MSNARVGAEKYPQKNAREYPKGFGGAQTRGQKTTVTVDIEETKKEKRRNKGMLAGGCCMIVLAVILILCFCGLGIAKIIMGALYFSDCPVQYLIPIYLIVSGCSSMFMAGLANMKKPQPDIDDIGIKEQCNICTLIGAIGSMFNFVWLICGSAWVFGNYSDVISGCGCPNHCCDKFLMQFAMAVTIIDWIFTGLILVGICCCCGAVCCGMLCCNRDKVRRINNSETHTEMDVYT